MRAGGGFGATGGAPRKPRPTSSKRRQRPRLSRPRTEPAQQPAASGSASRPQPQAAAGQLQPAEPPAAAPQTDQQPAEQPAPDDQQTTAPAATEPQQEQPAAPSGSGVAFRLRRGVSLFEVIDIFAQRLKINYMIDPAVPPDGSVTISTYGSLDQEDLFPLFETILRMNGLAAVQVGNVYRIVPLDGVQRLPIAPQGANGQQVPEDERMVLNIVHLRYSTAARRGGGARAVPRRGRPRPCRSTRPTRC